MEKLLHIGGAVLGFVAAVVLIVVGATNSGGTVPGWKFVLLGVAFAIGGVIALIDGARAFPQLGIWKVGAKFSGLSDLATLVILGVVGGSFAVAVLA
jgi:hypothetical protein